MHKNFRRKAFELLEGEAAAGPYNWVDAFLIGLICANVLAIIIDTLPGIALRYANFLLYFEVFSVAVFTVEYVLRVWACSENPRFPGVFRGRLKFIFTPLALVDLMAILPFYLPAVFPLELMVFRLFRLIRLLKITRYSASLKLFGTIVRSKREELLTSFVLILVLLLFSSSLMYLVEHQNQPKLFSSIPATMWWGVMTLTTVGYGDMYPVSALGKILGSLIALFSVGIFALPSGIIVAGFIEQVQKRRRTCPHCGKELD